jgi:hypothetical protein
MAHRAHLNPFQHAYLLARRRAQRQFRKGLLATDAELLAVEFDEPAFEASITEQALGFELVMECDRGE